MNQNKIRNVSVIAHIDAGKTSLCDTLLAMGRVIADKDAGTKRAMSTRQDEKDRGITIKAMGATINFDHAGETYKLNLVDSPGHVQFGGEVSCALRITDASLVIIDAVEGVQVQTETVLRQAIQEKIKPVLVINKIDRLFSELQEDPNRMYIRFEEQIKQINSLIATYSNNDPSLQLDPLNGSVIFSSAYYGWGFSLNDFAKFYSTKNGGEADRYIKMLWGRIDKRSGNPAFCQLVMDPIYKIYTSIMSGDVTQYESLLKKLGHDMTLDVNLNPKKVFGETMKKLFPLSNALTELIVKVLPSPVTAQASRMHVLYDGPLDDVRAQSITKCDASGPLVMYISKMIPDNTGKFMGFGRVFSGSIKPGQKITIMDGNFDGDNGLHIGKSVQRCCVIVAGKFENVDVIEAGNIGAIVGVDQYLLKTGTILDVDNNTFSIPVYGIKTMKFLVSPVVKVAVKPSNPIDISDFVSALRKLSKSDPCIFYSFDEETRETTISASGEMHMETCLNDLKLLMGSSREITVSEPIVAFRETIESVGCEPCLAKSSNKLNRIYISANKLNDKLVDDIETGIFNPNMDPKERTRTLVSNYGWDADEAKKIIRFGPAGVFTNVLVDATKGAQYMNEVRDSISAAFNAYTEKGPICEEQVRGVRFNVCDITVHPDPPHRSGAQIMPMVRKAMYASILRCEPILFEPVFVANIQIPDQLIGVIYNCMSQRRGIVINQEQKQDLPLTLIRAWVPVAESFGLDGFLREQTGGQAFTSLNFDCYQRVPGDMYNPESKNNEFVRSTRRRKNFNDQIPVYTDYMDKM